MSKYILIPAISLAAALACLLPAAANAYTVSGTASSPNDGSGGNPASFAYSSGPTSGSVSVSGTNAGGVFTASGAASASADLASASVHATASSLSSSLIGLPLFDPSSAQALVNETVTFSLPGSSATIGVFASLSGATTLLDPAGSVFNSFSVTFAGAASGVFSHVADASGVTNTGFGGSVVTGSGVENASFLGSLTISAADPVLSVNELLSIDSALGASTGEAGFLNFILPAGVTFSSTSGTFLSNPIPEPGAFALFGTALLGLGAVVRRRARD